MQRDQAAVQKGEFQKLSAKRDGLTALIQTFCPYVIGSAVMIVVLHEISAVVS